MQGKKETKTTAPVVKAEVKEAEKTVASLWNIGKVVTSERGE